MFWISRWRTGSARRARGQRLAIEHLLGDEPLDQPGLLRGRRRLPVASASNPRAGSRSARPRSSRSASRSSGSAGWASRALDGARGETVRRRRQRRLPGAPPGLHAVESSAQHQEVQDGASREARQCHAACRRRRRWRPSSAGRRIAADTRRERSRPAAGPPAGSRSARRPGPASCRSRCRTYPAASGGGLRPCGGGTMSEYCAELLWHSSGRKGSRPSCLQT